jgi:hypothetical protein
MFHRRSTRITTRYPRPDVLLSDRKRSRLTRFNDPASAENDYFRLSNRNS